MFLRHTAQKMTEDDDGEYEYAEQIDNDNDEAMDDHDSNQAKHRRRGDMQIANQQDWQNVTKDTNASKTLRGEGSVSSSESDESEGVEDYLLPGESFISPISLLELLSHFLYLNYSVISFI